MFLMNKETKEEFKVITEAAHISIADNCYVVESLKSGKTFVIPEYEKDRNYVEVFYPAKEPITKANYKTFKFDGVIAYRKRDGQPRDDGSFNGIGLIFEDAFLQDGSSCANKGRGYKSDDTSWINSIGFNEASDDFLPNGIYFNSTSRLNRDLEFNRYDFFERYECYKFRNVYEFARWVLENE